MSIHQSSYAGVMDWFVRRLARDRIVLLMFENRSEAIATHGDKVPFFVTNYRGLCDDYCFLVSQITTLGQGLLRRRLIAKDRSDAQIRDNVSTAESC